MHKPPVAATITIRLPLALVERLDEIVEARRRSLRDRRLLVYAHDVTRSSVMRDLLAKAANGRSQPRFADNGD